MSRYVISFLSHKGGGGKTTSSHLAAYGLALIGGGVIHAATDSIRTIKSSTDRPYNCYGAKTDDELKRTVERFSKAPDNADRDFYLIIDGGANKHKLDEALAQISDLVLIPVKDSFDDYEACLLDLQRLTGSFALRTAWPYEYLRIPLAETELTGALGDLSSRLFDHTISYSENVRLITNDSKLELLRKARNAARSFGFSIKSHLANKI